MHSLPCSAQPLTPVPSTSNIRIFNRLSGSRHQHRALNIHGSFGSWSGEPLGKGKVRQGGEETSGGVLRIKSHVGTWGSIPTEPGVMPWACLRVVPSRGMDASFVEGPSWDTSVFYRNSLQVPVPPERHTKSMGQTSQWFGPSDSHLTWFSGPRRSITTSPVWKADVGQVRPDLRTSGGFSHMLGPSSFRGMASLCSDDYSLASPDMWLPCCLCVIPGHLTPPLCL